MPTYLCHGFRWQRKSIIVYVVVQNLDDAAPQWVIKRHSARNLIESFYNLFDFLPPCTLPSSTTISRVGSFSAASQSLVSRQSTDDDRVSYHTPRSSSQSRSRSRTRTNTATAPRQQEQPRSQQITFGATLTRDDLSQVSSTTPTAARRPSSNSSRNRSETSSSGVGVSVAVPSPPPPSSSHAASIYQPAACRRSSSYSTSPSLAFDDTVHADPVLAQGWSPVKLLEEYDPANTAEVSGPHAYVADYVTRVTDSVSIVEEIQRYESRVRHSARPPVTGPSSDEMLDKERDTTKLGSAAGWLEQLRDELQRDEQIRWYVVVCGDEERTYPADETAQASGASRSSRGSVVQHQQYKQLVSEEQESVAGPRFSVVHHQQYKAMIFGEQPQDKEGKPEQPRKESSEQGAAERLMDRRLERRSKTASEGPPPAISVPSLRTRHPMTETVITSPAKSPRSPRTPGKGTFRRLFSRGKADDEAAV